MTPTYPDLAGKVAVVTGGSKGIGAATCRVLAANGVKVAVNGRSDAPARDVAGGIRRQGGDAIPVVADCTNRDDVERLRSTTESELGPADILLAFAGGFSRYTPAHEIGEDEWQEVLHQNLTSTFLTVRTFLPGMIERGHGAIVTMSSNAGRFLDTPTTASYAAAKAGVVMFTRHVAQEVGRHGIRVNCVAPATVLTERIEQITTEERRAELAAMAPLGRLGTPEDVALVTLFLVSDSASWLTGVTLDVTGGRIML
jgi:3-oxoacyl-[acyl-carrier protein] reductase